MVSSLRLDRLGDDPRGGTPGIQLLDDGVLYLSQALLVLLPIVLRVLLQGVEVPRVAAHRPAHQGYVHQMDRLRVGHTQTADGAAMKTAVEKEMTHILGIPGISPV